MTSKGNDHNSGRASQWWSAEGGLGSVLWVAISRSPFSRGLIIMGSHMQGSIQLGAFYGVQTSYIQGSIQLGAYYILWSRDLSYVGALSVGSFYGIGTRGRWWWWWWWGWGAYYGEGTSHIQELTHSVGGILWGRDLLYIEVCSVGNFLLGRNLSYARAHSVGVL